MRILIAPMAATAETTCSSSRARALAIEASGRGHEVALCAGEDVTYCPIPGVRNYAAPLPSPLGAPTFIGKRVSAVAERFGVQRRKTVHSFEEMLHLTGATAATFFSRDVRAVRDAIASFRPHLVFADFRIAAIVAARLETTNVATSFSSPVQASYASNPEYSEAVRQFLRTEGLPAVTSALEIFDWAPEKFIASSPDLEPLEGAGIHHVGAFLPWNRPAEVADGGKSIIAYMVNGTISPKVLVRVVTEAFRGTEFDVFIASPGEAAFTDDNLFVAPEFDLSQLMPEAAAYVNHGGQNSVMTGLVYGVPQIVVPGAVFECRYNAEAVVRLGAGVMLEAEEFTAERLRQQMTQLQGEPRFRINALKVGVNLLHLGGAASVVDILERNHRD